MGRSGRSKKRGSNSKTNPYSVRGLEKFSQITSELTAKRQEIASKIGASPSCVWMTTVASSDDLVAIFPSSFANKSTAAPATFELSPENSPHHSSPSCHPHQRCSNSLEPAYSSSLLAHIHPLPKPPKPTHLFTFIALFVTNIWEMLERFIRRRQKSVYKRVESFASYEPGLGVKHPPRQSFSAGNSPGEQLLNNTVNPQPIAACNGSPVQASTIADHPNLTPLRRIIATLPQQSALSASSSPILFTLRALQASSMKSAEAKTQNPSIEALRSNSGIESSEHMVRRSTARFLRSSRIVNFHVREDRSYGAMVMLVIMLASLAFGIVPGVLATVISWFLLPQLRGFVRNKDLRANKGGAPKRKQYSSPMIIKARKVDQSLSISKRRCMPKSTST